MRNDEYAIEANNLLNIYQSMKNCINYKHSIENKKNQNRSSMKSQTNRKFLKRLEVILFAAHVCKYNALLLDKFIRGKILEKDLELRMNKRSFPVYTL